MPLDRVHSSETQLFFTGIRVPAVQSIEFSTEKNSTDITPLGNLSYQDRILNSNQTTNLSYSILVTTGASGFDPFYTFQQSQSGFLSTTSYGFNIKDFAGENTITGAYLSSYSLEGSVGEFVKGSVSYEADSISFDTANSISFSDMSSDNFDVFQPRHISISTTPASSTINYTVTVQNVGGNKYFIDGAQQPTLELIEGNTYVFNWSDASAQGHPVRFSTTNDGTHGGGSEYTIGVTKDDSSYKTTIVVAAGAPTLYYYCQYHGGMGGQANTPSATVVESVSTTDLNIQSFSVGVNINRNLVTRVGSRTPSFRYPQLPIDGSLNVTFIKNQVTGIDLSPLVVDTGKIDINLKNDDGSTSMTYSMDQCSLKSVSESIDLDGNNTINFSYIFCVKKWK